MKISQRKLNLTLLQTILFVFIFSFAFAPFNMLYAQDGFEPKKPFGEDSLTDVVANTGGFNTEGGETFLATTLGRLAFTLFGFLGVIFTALILYGGFRWMIARGNDEEVSTAKKIIRNSVIGLVVTFASYSIWFIIERFFLLR